MNVNLSPGLAKVGVGNIFYVAMTNDRDQLETRPFIAVKAFNYGDILEEVRQEGLIKSEEVSARLCEILLEREYVWKAEVSILDLGVRGRASKALQEIGRYQYNSKHEMLKALTIEMETLFLTVECRSGDLHLLKIDKGDTLAQVRIFLDDHEALAEQVTLDLIGPMDYPLPDDLDDILGTAIKQWLTEQYPRLDIGITVRARKSDLIIAQEAIHARLRRKTPIKRPKRFAKGG